jgi:hypothetical protein
MRIGAVATEDITKDEVYIAVPNDAILSAESASKSAALQPLLRALLGVVHPSERDFLVLLLHLMCDDACACVRCAL